MKKIGVFYGSSTGNTEALARALHAELAPLAAAPRDIEHVRPEDIMAHDVLLLGISTWNMGEMQDSWHGMSARLAPMDWRGKTVGLFGCGDQWAYGDTFGDALGLLWAVLQPRGARLVGRWPTTDYDFDASLAVVDGMFLGLLADVDNQPDMTAHRVQTWAAQLRRELASVAA